MRLDCCMKLNYIKIDKSKIFKNFINIMNQIFVQFDINNIITINVFQCKINCLEKIQLINQINKT